MQFRYAPNLKSYLKSEQWMDFDHIYNGETVIFDEGAFNNETESLPVQVSGFKFNKQYLQIRDSMLHFNRHLDDVRKIVKRDPQRAVTVYADLQQRFSRIENLFDPYFDTLFNQYWISNLRYMHPEEAKAKGEFYRALLPRRQYREGYITYAKKSSYQKYLKQVIERVTTVDPKSPLIDSWHFVTGWSILNQMAIDYPDLSNKIGFSKESLFEFMKNLVDHVPNTKTKIGLLSSAGEEYCFYDKRRDPDKAYYFLNRILCDYPKHTIVTDGWIQTRINSLELIPGVEVSDFHVNTLSGNPISLSKYKDQFVLVVINDIWDSHSQNLFTGLDSLQKEYSEGKLKILGLIYAPDIMPKDEQESYLKYFPKFFDKALMTKSMAIDYGLIYIGGEFLIAPGGKLLARGFDHRKIADEVKDYIAQHEK
jgi:hypothetical protein